FAASRSDTDSLSGLIIFVRRDQWKPDGKDYWQGSHAKGQVVLHEVYGRRGRHEGIGAGGSDTHDHWKDVLRVVVDGRRSRRRERRSTPRHDDFDPRESQCE